MSLVERSRRLSPSTRKQESAYKVYTSGVGSDDTLRLTIKDPNERLIGLFEFSGIEIADRKSFHFRADQVGEKWEIRFSGALPIAVTI